MSHASWPTALTDPVARAGLGLLFALTVARVGARHRPAWRLGLHVAFFSTLTALLVYLGIVPFEATPHAVAMPGRLFLGIAETIWWISAAWSLISFVRVFVIFERKPREGRLIQDLVVGAIYIGTSLCVIAYVFNAPIGTLIATSGVLAIILGLAMQSTLSDVFSGIALNIGRPYGIGDWIILRDGIEGRVVETNWRATHLLDGANDLVIVPNSDLAKARLTNVSAPVRSHGSKITVRLLPTVQPSVMIDVMKTALIGSNTILPTPEPFVRVVSLDAQGAELELSFHVADISYTARAQNEIFDLVFRNAKSSGMELAPPSSHVAILADNSAAENAALAPKATPMRLVNALPLFAGLTVEEKETIAEAMVRRAYRKAVTIVAQGDILDRLIVIRTGVVTVTRREDAREIELGRLSPGDWFGENGLLAGAGEIGTMRALTFVVSYEIGKEAMAALLHERPQLVDELATIMARRTEVENRLFERDTVARSSESVPSIVARMRRLFEVPTHGDDD